MKTGALRAARDIPERIVPILAAAAPQAQTAGS
jgi:hypothetical protein